jgi:hypothetical protein
VAAGKEARMICNSVSRPTREASAVCRTTCGSGSSNLAIVLPTPGGGCPKSSCSRRKCERLASRLTDPKRFSSGPHVRNGPHKAGVELKRGERAAYRRGA